MAGSPGQRVASTRSRSSVRLRLNPLRVRRSTESRLLENSAARLTCHFVRAEIGWTIAPFWVSAGVTDFLPPLHTTARHVPDPKVFPCFVRQEALGPGEKLPTE